ncbi:MAG: amino acid permease [Candidatus Kapabacteria bacterium]|jgi:APA family basic amino acid/polyamine antiporter|nr:amino acid permease [Candidatus Kapabacteria bacterium]
MTQSDTPQPAPEQHFRRELGVVSSTMIVVGSMVGSGIFIVSADIARTVGSPVLLMAVWLATGLLTLIAALSYGELAGMMPEAGGQYVYLREAYSPIMGFLYGWTLFLVIQTGMIAAVAVAFAKFTAVLLPSLGTNNILVTLGDFKISAAQVFAIGSIIVLTYLNSRGVKGGKIVQDVFTVAKILGIAGLIFAGLTLGVNDEALVSNLSNLWKHSWTHLENGSVTGVQTLSGTWLLAAFGVAMVGSIFSSDAWNTITFAAGEVVNPKRTIPLSLFLGTCLVTVIYLLSNLAYLVTLPLVGDPNGQTVIQRGIQFATEDRVGTAVASVVWGSGAATVMAILIMISTFGCNNGLILSGARVFYAMSKDGLFFKRAGTLNRNDVPGYALIIQAVWASLLCLSGSYGDLLDYVVFAILVFYILTIGGIFILRAKRPNVERPYKAFGYPVLPALYILAALAICVNLLIFKPKFTYPGLFIVLSGIPVFYFWKRRQAS